MKRHFAMLIGLLVIMLCGIGPSMAGGSDFLPADQAFSPSARRIDASHIAVTWQIADGYYLYRHAFKFALADPSGTTHLGAPDLPDGKQHTDPYFGPVETYRRAIRVVLPIRGTGADAKDLHVQVDYQGCADAGLCYPPQSRTLDVAPSRQMEMPPATPSDNASDVASGASPSAGPVAPAGKPPQQKQLAERLAHGNPVLTLGLFFLLGIGLAFTPCILPMIPIISALVIGSTRADMHVGRRRALWLSSLYVLAMAAAYAVFGILAGYFGANIQAFLQRPLVLIPFAGLFALLAAASFGWLTFQLPGRWQSSISDMGSHRNGALGAALMGFLAALIAGPCLAPPLAGALLFITASGSLWLGGAALFLLGLGMGLPLIAIAVFGDALLPRRGAWMQEVRVLSGVVLIAVAIWLATRLASPPWALAAWGLLALLYGAYVSTRSANSATGRTIKRSAVAVLAGYALFAATGLAIGDARPGAPLAGLRAAQGSNDGHATEADQSSVFQRVTTRAQLQQALADARRAHRPAVVDFYADWCVECVQMEHQVFSQPRVRKALSTLTAIQVDVTRYNAQARAVMRSVGVFGPPTMLFYAADGSPIEQARLIGATDAPGLLARLRTARAGPD